MVSQCIWSSLSPRGESGQIWMKLICGSSPRKVLPLLCQFSIISPTRLVNENCYEHAITLPRLNAPFLRVPLSITARYSILPYVMSSHSSASSYSDPLSIHWGAAEIKLFGLGSPTQRRGWDLSNSSATNAEARTPRWRNFCSLNSSKTLFQRGSTRSALINFQTRREDCTSTYHLQIHKNHQLSVSICPVNIDHYVFVSQKYQEHTFLVDLASSFSSSEPLRLLTRSFSCLRPSREDIPKEQYSYRCPGGIIAFIIYICQSFLSHRRMHQLNDQCKVQIIISPDICRPLTVSSIRIYGIFLTYECTM